MHGPLITVIICLLAATGCSSMTNQERMAAEESNREHRRMREAPNDLRTNVGRDYLSEGLPPLIDPRRSR